MGQLAEMLKCGVPIAVALETLNRQTSSPTLARAIDIVCRKLAAGAYLSQAFSQFPRIFKPLHVSMVRIGERTGGLVVALEHLFHYLDRDYRLKKRLRGAMAYPVLVLVVTLFLSGVVCCTILPGFASMFTELHMKLPLLTLIVMRLVGWLTNPLCWVLVGSTGAVFIRLGRQYVSKSQLYRVLAAIPILGVLLRDAALTRFCMSMEALLSTGVELTLALDLASQAGDNPLFVEAGQATIRGVKNGASLSQAMAFSLKVYGRCVPSMVLAGEESGRLTASFGRLANYCDAELEYRVDQLSAALEPLLLALVSGLTATLLVAIFLPLYGYIAELGG